MRFLQISIAGILYLQEIKGGVLEGKGMCVGLDWQVAVRSSFCL